MLSTTQWVLDTAIAVGVKRDGTAISSDGSKLVVVNNAKPGMVKIVERAEHRWLQWRLWCGRTSQRNGGLIQGDSLQRVSLATNAVTKTLSPIYSTAFQGIAITADDKFAFAVGSFEKIVVSLADNKVIQTFSTGANSAATTPDGLRFYVTDGVNGTVRVYKRVGSP